MIRYGGAPETWLDLSTGINPVPYPLPALHARDWTRLPDAAATASLLAAARHFWQVPDDAAILAAPGTSSLIARIPALLPPAVVNIPGLTYNEHAAAFAAHGWHTGEAGEAFVAVHPNNPDGRIWKATDMPSARLMVIDESFCDCRPDESLIALASRPGVLILKGLGKFWGLAGLRLGFAMGDPALIARLSTLLGPWPVSGPALAAGTAALADAGWASATRARLAADAARLDAILIANGATLVGGTTLFRTYAVPDAGDWHERLARAHILTRIFPYSRHWLRLGLPGDETDWHRLEDAL